MPSMVLGVRIMLLKTIQFRYNSQTHTMYFYKYKDSYFRNLEKLESQNELENAFNFKYIKNNSLAQCIKYFIETIVDKNAEILPDE